jgi:urate oxidase
VVSGFCDLVVLKSTGSEFKGFLTDSYTTLQETDDRIMATSLTARWRYDGTGAERDTDWNASYEDIKAIMLAAFATTYSRALQETLYVMGQDVLKAHPDVAEIRFSAPNKHPSGSPTTVRCSSPRTGPTGSSRRPSPGTTPHRPGRPGRQSPRSREHLST